MLHIILYQPEIPPNTGNIIRLCANAGARLHLIEPLGFSIDNKKLVRAGLDYREFVDIQIYAHLESCLENLINIPHANIYSCSTKGQKYYTQINYSPDSIFIFGPETRGLPKEILVQFETIKIPMHPDSRSLNLSNAVAIILYEAWRQHNFNYL